MKKENVETGTFIKLIKPKLPKTYGQGKEPEGISVNKTYFIKYGGMFKVTGTLSKKEPINKDKPYPLISKEFVEENSEQFKEIKNQKPKE